MLLLWKRDERSQKSRPVRGSGRTQPHIGTPGRPLAGARTARTARSVLCPACWLRGILEPWGRAALRRHRSTADTSDGEEGAHGSQYGTHIFKPEPDREKDAHNSVYSGDILALFSVDSYAKEQTGIY